MKSPPPSRWYSRPRPTLGLGWVLCVGAPAALSGCIAFGYGDTSDVASPGIGGGRPGVDPSGNGRGDGGSRDAAPGADGMATDGAARDGATEGEGPAADGGDAGGQSQDAGPTPATLLNLPDDGELSSICYASGECNGDDLVCFGAVGEAPGLCVEDCDEDSDCGEVDGLQPSCTNGMCLVNCAGEQDAGDGPCPKSMECRAQLTEPIPGVLTPVVVALADPNYWCVYPVDAGSNRVPAMGKCDTAHGDGDCAGVLACHDPDGPGGHGYCTTTCEEDGDCGVPTGVGAAPWCFQGACELDCSAPGATCPAGMNCRDADPNPLVAAYRCLYID